MHKPLAKSLMKVTLEKQYIIHVWLISGFEIWGGPKAYILKSGLVPPPKYKFPVHAIRNVQMQLKSMGNKGLLQLDILIACVNIVCLKIMQCMYTHQRKAEGILGLVKCLIITKHVAVSN